jgi:DNA transformation protein
MTRPVSTIRNLGPASERAFARAGIDSAEALQALGADAAYARLLAAGQKPHFIGYYALVMGLMGRPWNDCRGAEKVELRARFDALVAGAGTPLPDRFERLLDELGLRPAADRTPPD